MMSKLCAIWDVASNSNVNLVNVLNIRIFAAQLKALLFGAHPLEQRLNVMLYSIVDEFVLGLRLHHAGTLRSDHLNCTLDIDFGVQAAAFDLIENHVDHNECTGSTDAS